MQTSTTFTEVSNWYWNLKRQSDWLTFVLLERVSDLAWVRKVFDAECLTLLYLYFRRLYRSWETGRRENPVMKKSVHVWKISSIWISSDIGGRIWSWALRTWELRSCNRRWFGPGQCLSSLMVLDSDVIMDTSGHFRRRQLYIQRLAFSHFVSCTRLLYLEGSVDASIALKG